MQKANWLRTVFGMQSGIALTDLVHAIREYRKLADQKPLKLQGSDFAQALQELNKAVDRAEGLLLQLSVCWKAPAFTEKRNMAST